MQSNPLRSPLALARRPPALDGQSIPGRLYRVGDYLAHEHADVIRQLTANNWRTPLPLPSHSRGRFTRKPAPWPTRANRPMPTPAPRLGPSGLRASPDGGEAAGHERQLFAARAAGLDPLPTDDIWKHTDGLRGASSRWQSLLGYQ